jgi:hypothetical protein
MQSIPAAPPWVKGQYKIQKGRSSGEVGRPGAERGVFLSATFF